MREILFRGKRIDNGEWVEGNLFIPDKVPHREAPTEILVGTNVVRISYEVDPATVGQYTGLTDKNGKRIFEGDVVYDGFTKDKVAFEDCQWKLVDRRGKWIPLLGREVEVIGNIHDNPELMKEETT